MELYIHSVMPVLQVPYKTTCIMAVKGDEAKNPPRNVIMRKVGITARIRPLLTAWNSLNFENFFMNSAYNSLPNNKSPTYKE